MSKKNKFKPQDVVSQVPSSTSRNTETIKTNSQNSIFTNSWLLIGILAIAVLIAYFGAFKNDFVGWDDNSYLSDNPDMMKRNWERLWRSVYVGNYHPLTMVSLAINGFLFGKGAGSYIFINTLFHIFNTIFVFVFIKKLSNNNLFVSFFTALLFGVHPMHVESVAWVSERKDVLYTFFFLLSCIFYIKSIKEENKKWLLYAFITFILSCLSKGMAVVLPVVLILIDYWMNGNIKKENIITKWYFFSFALFFGILTLNAQGGGNFGGLLIATTDSAAYNNNWTIFDKFLFAGYGFMMYIFKLFAPFNLHHFYAYPYTNEKRGLVYVLLPIISLGVLAYGLWSYKRQKEVFFGILFFFVTIILVLQIIAVGSAIMAERYSYIPYIGLFFMILYWLDSKFKQEKTIVVGILCLLSVICLYLTTQQVKTWKDTIALLENSYPHHPDNAYLAGGLASWYGQHDRPDDALKICDGSISRGAADYKFYEIAGNASATKKDFNKALQYYNGGLKFADQKQKAGLYRNMAVVNQNINQSEAIRQFTIALEFGDDPKEVISSRATSYLANRQYTDALKDFNEVIRLGVATDNSYTDRAVARYQLGDKNGAIEDLRMALKINPSNKVASDNLKQIRVAL
jgi:protein O-mannosyl-transferase